MSRIRKGRMSAGSLGASGALRHMPYGRVAIVMVGTSRSKLAILLSVATVILSIGCGRDSLLVRSKPDAQTPAPSGQIALLLVRAERIDGLRPNAWTYEVTVFDDGQLERTDTFPADQDVVVLQGLPVGRFFDIHVSAKDVQSRETFFGRLVGVESIRDATAEPFACRLSPVYVAEEVNILGGDAAPGFVSFLDGISFPWLVDQFNGNQIEFVRLEDESGVTASGAEEIDIYLHFNYEEATAHNFRDYMKFYFSGSRAYSSGMELRRWYETPTEEEFEQGVWQVLLIEYFHPTQMFYDFFMGTLARLDLSYTIYREPIKPVQFWGYKAK